MHEDDFEWYSMSLRTIAKTFLEVGTLVVCDVSGIQYSTREHFWVQSHQSTSVRKMVFLIIGYVPNMTVYDSTRHYLTDKGALTITKPGDCTIMNTLKHF